MKDLQSLHANFSINYRSFKPKQLPDLEVLTGQGLRIRNLRSAGFLGNLKGLAIDTSRGTGTGVKYQQEIQEHAPKVLGRLHSLEYLHTDNSFFPIDNMYQFWSLLPNKNTMELTLDFSDPEFSSFVENIIKDKKSSYFQNVVSLGISGEGYTHAASDTDSRQSKHSKMIKRLRKLRHKFPKLYALQMKSRFFLRSNEVTPEHTQQIKKETEGLDYFEIETRAPHTERFLGQTFYYPDRYSPQSNHFRCVANLMGLGN